MKYKYALTVLTASILSASVLFIEIAHAKGLQALPDKKVRSINQIELLFYQRAETAMIKPHARSTQCYDLALSELSPHVVYFANYPSHQAGQMTVLNYSESINHAISTSSIRPNAILHAHIQSKLAKENDEAFMINRPIEIRTSSYDAINQRMQYLVCDLEKNQAVMNYNLKHIDLFIDPFHRYPM